MKKIFGWLILAIGTIGVIALNWFVLGVFAYAVLGATFWEGFAFIFIGSFLQPIFSFIGSLGASMVDDA